MAWENATLAHRSQQFSWLMLHQSSGTIKIVIMKGLQYLISLENKHLTLISLFFSPHFFSHKCSLKVFMMQSDVLTTHETRKKKSPAITVLQPLRGFTEKHREWVFPVSHVSLVSIRQTDRNFRNYLERDWFAYHLGLYERAILSLTFWPTANLLIIPRSVRNTRA